MGSAVKGLIKITRAVVRMYSLLCVFISQYSNKVDFILIDEPQMGAKGEDGPKLGDQGLLAFPVQPPLPQRFS